MFKQPLKKVDLTPRGVYSRFITFGSQAVGRSSKVLSIVLHTRQLFAHRIPLRTQALAGGP